MLNGTDGMMHGRDGMIYGETGFEVRFLSDGQVAGDKSGSDNFVQRPRNEVRRMDGMMYGSGQNAITSPALDTGCNLSNVLGTKYDVRTE